ncbi:LysR family transcriptional regulator [Sphingosinicella sp. LY1275]|uniref:LysR family transcriptional regulator n=1 Tax=Sphingosinicella sp. LY1275 TaxID=3095379 RepID=UPI002ADED8F3|nr:LysR family transcriptional regulator [Sphingosinicella sp. LY1275]MEA1014719.1 LysR family transcriptional regulator [Sphingosinicella sp. LY1275]
MQWDDLRHFLAVARAGQLSRAASGLGVDATTVGRRLRRLEKALGQSLFEQTQEGQALTEAGERLLVKAEAVEREMRAIEAGPEAGHDLAGSIRVSVSEGFGTWFVAHHLESFAAAHPRLRIDLVASSGFLNPSRREADVAILLARPRKGPLFTRKLTDYRLRLYAARSYLDTHGPVDGVEALRGHALIGYVPDLLYAPELRYLAEIAPALEPRIRSTSINAQYRLVASGAGIAVLPCFIGDADAGLVRVLDDIAVTRSFWLVTHADTRQLPRVEAFVAWLTELVGARQPRLLGA